MIWLFCSCNRLAGFDISGKKREDDSEDILGNVCTLKRCVQWMWKWYMEIVAQLQ